VYTKNKTAGLLLTAMAAAILLSGCTSEKPVETSQNAPPGREQGAARGTKAYR
jgi:outer membrane biogenesis lipoprotein LolB